MKKLKLNLDEIQVFSFVVETTGSSSGTVNAFSNTDIGCGSWDCTGNLSCGSCHPYDCPRDPITWDC